MRLNMKRPAKTMHSNCAETDQERSALRAMDDVTSLRCFAAQGLRVRPPQRTPRIARTNTVPRMNHTAVRTNTAVYPANKLMGLNALSVRPVIAGANTCGSTSETCQM